MKRQITPFEAQAHDLEVTWKGQRPSYKNTWPTALKEKATMIDYILFAALPLLGIGLLIALI